MMDQQQIGVVFWDAETGDEIEGIDFMLQVPVHVGEEIHYWQDGTEENAAADSGIRRDFIVKRIHHDLRHIPGRGGRPRYVHTLEVFVTEIKPE